LVKNEFLSYSQMPSSCNPSIYKNGRAYVCLSVVLLVCGELMDIQTPAIKILIKFCTHIPTCPRKVLVLVWPPPPLGLGGGNHISWRTHFWNCLLKQKMFSRLQINPGSAGYLSYNNNLVQYRLRQCWWMANTFIGFCHRSIMLTADYCYPYLECLLNFFAIRGWKIAAWVAEDWAQNIGS